MGTVKYERSYVSRNDFYDKESRIEEVVGAAK
jgi:hypothetical protein